jgi:hypothetical protein
MEKNEIKQKAHLALLDIIRGYSILNYSGGELYFRHFSLIESLQFDEFYQKTIESAKRSGIKDEELIIKDAIKNKKWTLEKEEQIKSLTWGIEKLSNASKKISDFFQRKTVENTINSQKEELLNLQSERREICCFSAESFSEVKKIKKILNCCIYTDESFSKNIEDEKSMSFASLVFEKINFLNNSDIIANAAYSAYFFELFSINYRNPHVLFKQQGLEMTIFQKNLVTYANAILSKLKNVEIPEAIYEDPVKILSYKKLEKSSSGKTSVGLDDLKEKSAKNNGQLNPEDFLN